MKSRPSRLTLAVGIAVALLVPAAPVAAPASAGTEFIPDLSVAPLSEVRIQWAEGRRLLRFTSTMVNVGAGHFELRGTRAGTSQPMAIQQVIYPGIERDLQPSSVLETPAIASWAGDGHSHWHVQEMVRFDVWGPTEVLRGAKIGFCFLDSVPYDVLLPGASPTPHYQWSWCGHDPDALDVRMGVSVGWGDEYGWSLPFQWVDITGLPSGSYTLRARVDPHQFFVEANEANQCAFVTLSLSAETDAVTITGSGSACVDDWSGSAFAADIAWAFGAGITTGCAPELFCPARVVSREEMASFIARAIPLPPAGGDFFTDDESSIHEPAINVIAQDGITLGCGPGLYCPHGPVSREQMASFLVRALDLPPTSTDFFTDDEASVHEGDINAFAAGGITTGCSAGLFCPTGLVTREQMAAFLHRAFD